MQCIVSDINCVIVDSGLSNVLIGGDFNFEFGNTCNCIGCDIFMQLINQLTIMPCDDLISTTDDQSLVTYVASSNTSSSFLDHFCASTEVMERVIDSSILYSGENRPRLRWDKADTISYYFDTLHNLSSV